MYAQWRGGFHEQAIAADKARTPAPQSERQEPETKSKEKPAQGEGSGQGADGQKQDKGESAETDTKTKKGSDADKGDKNTQQKITKFLFDTTKGKITVAAAAVAIVSLVLAMMLGKRNST